jgi:hypothetical protein
MRRRVGIWRVGARKVARLRCQREEHRIPILRRTIVSLRRSNAILASKIAAIVACGATPVTGQEACHGVVHCVLERRGGCRLSGIEGALSSLFRATIFLGWREDNPAHNWDRSHIKERRDPIYLPPEEHVLAVIVASPSVLGEGSPIFQNAPTCSGTTTGNCTRTWPVGTARSE